MKKQIPAILGVIAILIAVFLGGLFFGRKLTSTPIQISAGVSDGPATVPSSAPQSAAEDPAVEFPIDINSADIPELVALPGIGDVLAQRIVDYRNSHGPFTVPEDLMEVYGISEKRFEAIKDYITIGG